MHFSHVLFRYCVRPDRSIGEGLGRLTPDEQHMHRAIALGFQAAGQVRPNPMVGCVLVKEGRVIGEGWHRGPGHPHAEVDALAKASKGGAKGAAKGAARGATAYVTLEPCNHYGNTPPCASALIDAEVAEVIYAVADPNPLAAGGAERLRTAGIAVRMGVAAAAAMDLVRPWIHGLTHKTPYVYAKMAMTLDGRTATRIGASKWITGPDARQMGHMLRQRTDAILVGSGTVIADDPGLDPRPADVDPVPSFKVVLDTQLRTPPTARMFGTPGDVILACGEDAPRARRDRLVDAGARIAVLPLRDGRVDLAALLAHLHEVGCQSVMIEGGGTLLGSAFDAGLVQEVWTFLAPMIMGGGRPAIAGRGPTQLAGAHSLTLLEQRRLGDDIFIRGIIENKEDPCSLAS